MRKKLSKTQREIVIGKDKSKCCKEHLEQSRIYPFDVYCPNCHKGMEFEDEIIFYKKDKLDNFIEKLIDKMEAGTKASVLNEYDKIKIELIGNK